jgi:SNF2 family DNA or RNA helicase
VGRQHLLAQRLFALDEVSRRQVAGGGEVTHTVVGSVAPDMPRSDRVFSSSDLIRPLLLPRPDAKHLYGYQRKGVAWLLRTPRALLADDMGLGKTAQAIEALRRLVRVAKVDWALVVAPRTLLPTWATEARRWAPELCVLTVLPRSAEREARWRRATGRCHLALTSYEQLRDVAKALVDHPPALLIADEAHRIRKRHSLATEGIRKVQSERIWALSGTPVERDSQDLAVLMSMLDSRKFSSVDGQLHRNSLRARVRPYLLRRKKEDVLKELPSVVEQEEELALSPTQKKAYSQAIRTHAAKRDGANNYLALFNELMSICDMDQASGESSKLDRIVEIMEDIRISGDKAVVFSYTKAPLHSLRARLNDTGTKCCFLVGDQSIQERQSEIDTFRKRADTTALLASSRIASEGLTLVEANHVIFINRWWNPSANNQARDRVVRIGQKKAVYVWTFLSSQTIESRLKVILSEKKKTFDELIESVTHGGDSELFGEETSGSP